MITRFVYPKVDMFFKKRGMMKEAYQLAISSTSDDGQCWFGIREAIENLGLFYGMRSVGSPRENEDFSLPKNRMAWVYNAYHKNVLERGEQFDKYEDDGKLKWLCFGVHSHDFELAHNWDELEEFARRYGNRKGDFYYATNAEIFDYEDAVKSAVVTDESVYNPSIIDLYMKIDGKNTVLKAGECITL